MSERLESLFDRFRRHGDVEALGQVFDAVAPTLSRVARHLTRDASAAEDLVQATFLAAIEKRATFDAERELSPWLTGILLRQASLERRARARVVEPDRLGSRDPEDPADVVSARELSDALTLALSRQRPVDREVLIPLLLDERRAVEIARELGRRPDTVHMRIHRGLQRLRRLLPAGFALGILARLAGARGLGAVRAEVLRAASVEVQGVSAATVGAVTVGIAMSMKKIAVAVALVLVLGIGGYRIATSAGVELVEQPALIGSGVGAIAGTDAQQAPDDEARRAAIAPTLEKRDATATAEHELTFDVVREDGGVASLVPVALVSADGKFANRQTDANGSCAFPLDKLGSSAVTGHLYIRDDAAFPQHFAIDLTAGRRTIELSRGAEFSGRLAMKGDVPLPRFELQLTSDSAPPGLAGASIRVFRALEMLRYDSPYVVARTTTGADGAFRFRVPDSDWSGVLRLPTEFVFVEGAIPTRSSERVILSTTTAFEATIAYRPRIIGRFVDEATRAPVADAEFLCDLIWSDGNGMGTAGVTGADGRFTIALDYRTDASELRIDRISMRDGRTAHVAEPSKWKGPCEPFDAADIECAFPASRSIIFRAFDASGAPLAQTRAAIRRGPTAQAAQHGVGTLFAVPLDATEVRFVAPGHAITTVAITPDTVSPIDVVLARTNRLTIALPREAAGRRDLQVKLVSRPLLFGGTSRMYDPYLRGGMVGTCFSADGDKGTREGSVRLGFSDDGLIELEGIATEVPFRIQLVAGTNEAGEDDVRQEVAIESLGLEEQRRVDLALPPGGSRSLIVLRGRVTDERGRPIHGAVLSSEFGAERAWAHSGLDGTFRLDRPDPDAVDVEASKRGYVPFRVRGWDVTSDRVLEATLRRGRDLRVELVDTKGRAIVGAQVSADIAGFGPPWKIEDGGAGIHTLCDLPSGRVDITVQIARRTYARSHDGAGDVARIVLPEHGRLEVAWKPDRARQDDRMAYQLALRPLGVDGSIQTTWVSSVDEHGREVFEAALCGDYTIGLESGLHTPNGEGIVFAPIGEPKRVTIVGCETVRIEL